jgi:protein-tyrosine phosphatase
MKVLMVCLGNICRSPIAEGVLQAKVKKNGLNWVVDSAGTFDYHIGEAPHYSSQSVCKKNKIDISQQKARKFLKEDFDHFDRIYAMANDVLLQIEKIAGEKFDQTKVELFLNELNPGKNEDVYDPWYGPENSFNTVFDVIDITCDKIIEKYKDGY